MLGIVAGRMHPEVMVRHVRPPSPLLLLCDNKMAVVLERDGEIMVKLEDKGVALQGDAYSLHPVS